MLNSPNAPEEKLIEAKNKLAAIEKIYSDMVTLLHLPNLYFARIVYFYQVKTLSLLFVIIVFVLQKNNDSKIIAQLKEQTAKMMAIENADVVVTSVQSCWSSCFENDFVPSQ